MQCQCNVVKNPIINEFHCFFFAVALALKPTKILETEFQIKIKCLIEYQHLCYPIDSQGRIKTINLYIPINQSLMSLIF